MSTSPLMWTAARPPDVLIKDVIREVCVDRRLRENLYEKLENL